MDAFDSLRSLKESEEKDRGQRMCDRLRRVKVRNSEHVLINAWAKSVESMCVQAVYGDVAAYIPQPENTEAEMRTNTRIYESHALDDYEISDRFCIKQRDYHDLERDAQHQRSKSHEKLKAIQEDNKTKKSDILKMK
ncbi:hypothetical protein MG293_019388 [Ovis ammon polii]|uniref:Uncharacterized protein n=1 Tax=Ovis ammon polii TaxID=230172 RepID=A0AAD4Y0H0_OVIAM|nr:hypothetical protein MG293_019388 [Ovis ammon polii]